VIAEERECIVLNNEGQKIFGILHLPSHVKNPPCVLICHGLGGHKTGRYRIYVELAEALVKQGIAAFRFDFRGSGDSEGSFIDMTLHGEVSDAVKALEYLEKEPRIDRDRIGLFGRSLGGAIAVMVAARFGKAKSIALWAPMYSGEDWLHLWDKIQSGTLSSEESEEFRRINGQVASIDFYGEMFKMRIDNELQELMHIPLLLMHGEQDEVISPTHSDKYLDDRKVSGAKTEIVKLPHGDHDFTQAQERAYAVMRTAEWFMETL
jgi:dipeptidyl aminopeptidase/acylaminoacyl peptidase